MILKRGASHPRQLRDLTSISKPFPCGLTKKIPRQLTRRWDLLVWKQEPINVIPLFLVGLSPRGVLPGLELFLLVGGDVAGRSDVQDLATHYRHLVLGQFSGIVKRLLASLAVGCVMSSVEMLPIRRRQPWSVLGVGEGKYLSLEMVNHDLIAQTS